MLKSITFCAMGEGETCILAAMRPALRARSARGDGPPRVRNADAPWSARATMTAERVAIFVCCGLLAKRGAWGAVIRLATHAVLRE